MTKNSLLFVVVALATAIAVVGLYLTNVIDVDIWGTVNVSKPVVIERDIELNIVTEKGSRILDLGVIEIPRNGAILVKGYLVNYKGDFKLLLSGVLELKSEKALYRITMPCLVSIGEQCYRIMMVIPGYDEPMTIEGGKYSATLILEWSASGTGSFHLKLLGTYSEEPQPLVSIKVIGSEPEELGENWALANGSTRSYALHVAPIAPNRIWAYFWLFDPYNSTGVRQVVLRVLDAETGALLELKAVDLFRENVYWKVLVEIVVPKPSKYLVQCLFSDRELSALVSL